MPSYRFPHRVSPTCLEIDLKALRHNFLALKKAGPTGTKFLATVKSDAYGHGAVDCARALERAGADFFGVGTVDEGVELRRAGIHRPILILLGILPAGGIAERSVFEALLQNRLTPVIGDWASARRLDRFLKRRGKRVEVHLKIDTGMGRLGVLASESTVFFRKIRRLKHLEPVGLLSHLADADDARFTARQYRLFRAAARTFCGFFPKARFLHLDNSLAAIGRRSVIGLGRGWRSIQEIVRWGIALYGASPSRRVMRKVRLKPVLSWKTKIAGLKEVPAGTDVSYLRTFRTRRRSRIAVLPVGYADGYPRHLSNRAEVLVRGRRVPVAGNVCMDMMMIDVTRARKARIGDEVVLLGRQGRKEIRAEELASQAGTISYEIFCRLSKRIERRVVR